MKNVFATVIGTSVLTAGIVSMSAIGVRAATLVGTYNGNDDKSPVTYNGVTYDFFSKYNTADSGVVADGTFEDKVFDIAATVTDGNEWKGGTANGGTGAGLFSVKAGNGYALYYTDDLSSIEWDTSDRQNKGLSHLSIWAGPGGGNPTEEVPEPLTMMGSAVALGFGGYFQKKRNAKKSAK